MTTVILTGPPASGKNTIAALVAQQLDRCAVIDVDIVRWMILQPHKAPWEGEEGQAQQFLGVQNACLLAQNFVRENYHALILDVLTNETAQLYKTGLSGLETKTVLLLPTLAEIQQRNLNRGPRLTDEEVQMLYNWQEHLTDYDLRIDNSTLPAEEVAAQFLKSVIGQGRLC